MMLLCTGKPSVQIEGERIVITIPSGKETVEVAMTLNEALVLRASVGRATDQALLSDFAAPSAEVVAFVRRRKRKEA